RGLSGVRKVGHLGTLDPNATGVLPLLIGRATRLAQFFGRAEKKYEGVVHFGHSTDTFDVEGKPTSEPVQVALVREALERALDQFRGVIMQVPPPVSAKKVGGVPAYKLARRNEPPNLPPVQVEIFSISVLWFESPKAALSVHCSAGTYVRSIAHDLGKLLGCGAYLDSLRRTSSGDFHLSMARTVDQLSGLANQGRIGEALVPSASLLPDFPAETFDSPTVAFIRQGREFRTSPFRTVRDARFVKAVDADGELIAIGEAKLPNVYHPVIVL
ncbi:MAG: tRNA pseudouridine(55) synthase TruB, partial [Bryobacteraceae bacterium]|nr:tRNA pseudouridine(55) synthase TruB [Bryobacteraceae bacterium]